MRDRKEASASGAVTRATMLSILTFGVSTQERYDTTYPLQHRCPYILLWKLP
jgi:hypothetical protein